MPIIRAITNEEYELWLAKVIPSYAADKVTTGKWTEETALELSRKEYATLLPQGKDTPDNHMFAVLEDAGTQVGTLWFAVKDRGKDRVAYVFDIEIMPEHRRQGYGRRAFEALEVEVKKLGLSGIALHVFGHNLAGQALYAKLGYVPTNISMYKPLEG